jgi:hypothetical protein
VFMSVLWFATGRMTGFPFQAVEEIFLFSVIFTRATSRHKKPHIHCAFSRG